METLSFKDGNIKIKFKLDEDAYFYAMKDHENLSGAIKVVITEINDTKILHLCTYYKSWYDDKFNSVVYSTFIRKFLENIKFRNTVECDGTPWTGTVKFSNDKGVNIKCANKIQALNKHKNPKFKDFAELKSFGFDKYSRMKYDSLIELVDDKTLKVIKDSFNNENLIVKALRWNVRGLLPHLSVRKVKTDIEISNNVK